MKKGVFCVVAALALYSCGLNGGKTVGNLYNWKSLSPPRANVLGKEVLSGDVLGDTLVKVTEQNIERSPSVVSITDDQYKNLTAKADLSVAQASANLGLTNVSSEKLIATDLEVSQIHNFVESLPVNRTFVFQCIHAKEHKFEGSSTTGGAATIDVSRVAAQFGVDIAKVELTSKPDSPNKIEVKISNPNVCLSYKTARFQDDNDFIVGIFEDKYVDITGNGDAYAIGFTLALGEKSNWRAPRFLGKEPANKPWYRLMAVRGEKSGQISLAVCKQDRGYSDKKHSCVELEDDGYGKWDRPYCVDVFSYGDQRYKVIWINMSAKRDGENIVVAWAKMQYPQYVLKVE
jgi:hypothetical protein